MQFDWETLCTGGIFISLFLFLLILGKRNKTTADRILAVWFFFAVLHQVLTGWYATGRIYSLPALYGWELPFPFLHGPFLYLYILYLTGQQRYGRWSLLHFVPALVAVILLWPVLTSLTIAELGDESKRAPYQLLFDGLNIAIMLSGVVYVVLSLVLLSRHRRNIAGQFSNTDKITLNWIRYLISGMGVIWVVVIFAGGPQVLYVAVALFIFFIGYFGIRQVGIFAQPLPVAALPVPEEVTPVSPLPEAVPEVVSTLPQKYERSGLTDAAAADIHSRMVAVMAERALYLDPELTLGDLAQALGVHSSILSQVINSQEGKTFYDYVNALRVEAFKREVASPASAQYTLLSLAYSCGFNSKSSFNRNFKKIMHCSPSAYLKTLGITPDISDDTVSD